MNSNVLDRATPEDILWREGIEMNTLERISKIEMLKVPLFELDNFQAEVLANLHLEFFLKHGRCLITPDLDYYVIGEATPEEEALLQGILETQKEALGKVKKYLIYNLSLYSALLETNSYYISLNNNLLIVRFLSLAAGGDDFELKIYTVSQADLPDNYKDKIYLGRDFISLRQLRREHFGLKFIRDSIRQQVSRLESRIQEHVSAADIKELRQEFLQEIEELVSEFSEQATEILERFPVDLTSHTVEKKTLIEANMLFREARHIMVELEESVREMEKRMFEKDLARAVRYVTKFRKDTTNDINYIMIKIIGRISDYVNGIHI